MTERCATRRWSSLFKTYCIIYVHLWPNYKYALIISSLNIYGCCSGCVLWSGRKTNTKLECILFLILWPDENFIVVFDPWCGCNTHCLRIVFAHYRCMKFVAFICATTYRFITICMVLVAVSYLVFIETHSFYSPKLCASNVLFRVCIVHTIT